MCRNIIPYYSNANPNNSYRVGLLQEGVIDIEFTALSSTATLGLGGDLPQAINIGGSTPEEAAPPSKPPPIQYPVMQQINPLLYSYRYGFNGKENDDEIGYQDYGMRMYNPALARFISVDPETFAYVSWSPFNYVRNNPILRLDPNGKLDIDIHTFSDRGKMSYGIAILRNNNGEEIYRFVVRVAGSAAVKIRSNGASSSQNLRVISNGDTPTGTYKIDEKKAWWFNETSQQDAYGVGYRLAMVGVSGEIMQASKDRQTTIRIHAGRQEINNKSNFDPNNKLKYTNGCARAFQADIDRCKELTDALETANAEENGNFVTITDDLVDTGNGFYLQSDINFYNDEILNISNQYRDLINNANSGSDVKKANQWKSSAMKNAKKELESKAINPKDFQTNGQ